MIEYIYAKYTFGVRRTITTEHAHKKQHNAQQVIARQFVCTSRIEIRKHFATLEHNFLKRIDYIYGALTCTNTRWGKVM